MSAEGGPSEITSDKGITIVSSDPITDAEREYLTPKAKPIPPDAKPGKEAKPEKAVTVESVDSRGREHGADGKFKGNGKSEEAPEVVAKPDEAEAAKTEAKKRDAQTRIRDLAEKKNQAEARAAAAERRAADAERRAAERPAERPQERPEARPANGKPKLADFGPVDEVATWEKYQDAHDAWLTEAVQAKAEARLSAREQEREQGRQQAELDVHIQKAIKEADEAIEKAGGETFLKTVEPVMSRIVPSIEADRLGMPRNAMTGLGDFVLYSGADGVRIMEYLRDNPEIVDRFEAIGDLPDSRQPLIFERELGMLAGTLRALKGTASVTADTSEPVRDAFKPRANPPVQSVTGSPHIAEPDLSKIDDFDKYMAAKGHRPRR